MLYTNDTQVRDLHRVSTLQPHSASVVSLQICPGHRKPMKPVETVEALAGIGLKGDLHALAESSRQVLLLELETLQQLQLTPGLVKENITTAGIALMSLRRGQRIQVGQTVLQVTKPCSPCNRLEEIRAGLQEELMGRRGMLARVVQSGTIRVGDSITLLDQP